MTDDEMDRASRKDSQKIGIDKSSRTSHVTRICSSVLYHTFRAEIRGASMKLMWASRERPNITRKNYADSISAQVIYMKAVDRK